MSSRKRSSDAYMRRYTDVMSVIDMIRHERLTLLDTDGWTDRNDRGAMKLFQNMSGAQQVRALCLTQTDETNHHWQVFSGHPAGACVVFKRDALLESIPNDDRFMHRAVDYRFSDELNSSDFGINDLPFLKRRVFEDEQEYRIVASLRPGDPAYECRYVPIKLNAIEVVVFSAKAPQALAETLRGVLRGWPHSKKLRTHHSHLEENADWRDAMNKHFNSPGVL